MEDVVSSLAASRLEDVDGIRPGGAMVDQNAGAAVERICAVGVGRGLHDLHPRGDGKEVETAAPSSCLLVAAINHHQVVGQRPIRLDTCRDGPRGNPGRTTARDRLSSSRGPGCPSDGGRRSRWHSAGPSSRDRGPRSAGNLGPGRETPRPATRPMPSHALPVPAHAAARNRATGPATDLPRPFPSTAPGAARWDRRRPAIRRKCR